jgi:hypothetical protein
VNHEASKMILRFGEAALSTEDAVRRAVDFAGSKGSGFITYDLAGLRERQDGRLQDVGPWTLLLANALNARVGLSGVNALYERLDDFAEALMRIPADKDIHELVQEEFEAVKQFCHFCVERARTATITKVGHLYRPRAIPILDREVASAYSYTGDDMRYIEFARENLLNRERRFLNRPLS